ncbi:interleukin-15 receptor subunit alpha isoform X2 [Mugil cephalus]|uniref:interleukin-15 receptor subunit alpha isoform X2 n=1 Tax=Mugil cephalus TaxID=48193 RepID=UPI001FB80A79|nr:interleukin-15 receptor subunit alpha isoform X2 [Mugil cephalus]
MDPGSLSLPAAMVLMVVLLGAAPLSSADQQSCTCPEIVQLPYTQPPEQKCYRVGNTYRYKCVEGRVRTAGTSDFIRCEQKDNGVQWTTPSLVCKPDPKLQTTTTPPTRTVENKNNCACPKIPERPLTQPPGETCIQINGTYRYTCLENYVRKAGTSNLTRCKLSGGALIWTDTNLECIPSPKRNATQSPENTISTTSSSPQTTCSTSSLATGTGETERVATTTHDPMTTVSNQTNQNSTHSMETSTHEAQKAIAQAAGISGFILIICVVILILFVLYRRRSQNNTPQATAEEQVPMNSQGGGRGPGA